MSTLASRFVEAVYAMPTASNEWTQPQVARHRAGASTEDLHGPMVFDGEYVTMVTFSDGSQARESWAREGGRTYFDGVSAVDPFPYVEPAPREPDEFDNF
jgi:hypothetical protein